MAELALRWRKKNAIVSHVSPGSAVRLESLDGNDGNSSVAVFHLPERVLRRALLKLSGRAGIELTRLVFDEEGNHGPLSELWRAAQLPPKNKPTRYVAVAEDGGASGPLYVTDSVAFEIENRVDGDVGVGGLIGPVAAKAKVGGSRRTSVKGTAYGVMDPEVGLRWLTSAGGGIDFAEYFDPYLAVYTELIGGPERSTPLSEVFRDEYRDCFEEPARIGAEFRPSGFEIGESESVEVEVDLFAQTKGRALAAVAMVDANDEQVLAVSDLMVLTHSEEGILFCE